MVRASPALLVVSAVLLSSSPALAVDTPDARDSAHPCRPTVSCTADLTSPGTLEIEAGELYARASGGARAASIPVLLKQTLTPLVQLQAGSNGPTVLGPAPQARYLDNAIFGPKLHLLDQGDLRPSFALSAQLSLPTFPASGYALHDDAFFTAFASKDLGRLHVDFNVGLLAWQVDGAAQPQGFAALALSTPLSTLLGVALEGYVFSDAAPAATHDGGLRAALGLSARPWLVVDLGGDAGFFPATRAYSLFVGATVIPAVLWRP
jgi:hypothetical protein